MLGPTIVYVLIVGRGFVFYIEFEQSSGMKRRKRANAKKKAEKPCFASVPGSTGLFAPTRSPTLWGSETVKNKRKKGVFFLPAVFCHAPRQDCSSKRRTI
jgi:hypothetical protein